MVRYVICSHPGSKSLSVALGLTMGSRIVLTQSAPCNDLMPEVFSYKDKKSNWPLPFYMFQRKRMFYGPKEAIWIECEMRIRVVLRRIRNVNAFKRITTSKVMKCFQMFKESFNGSLKKRFRMC